MNDTLEKNDEEISLVDLFAVLVRYRKLIGVMMFFTVVLAVAGYFFYPAYKYKKQWKGVSNTYEITVPMRIHPGAFFFINSARFRFYFTYPEIIRSLFEDTNQNLDDEKILAWLPPTFAVTKDGETTYVSKNEKFTIKERMGGFEFIYKTDNSESGIVFLQNYLSRLNKAVEQEVRPLAQSYVEIYEGNMDNEAFVDFSGNANPNMYIMTKVWLKENADPLIQSFDPQVVELTHLNTMSQLRSKYIKMALIFVFAVFFFSVFLAFALNAIRSIKNDEEAMAKIRDALGRPAGNNQ